MSVESSLAIPQGWGTPEPPDPPKGEKVWTVESLLDTIATTGGFSQGHVPDAQEAETLAAQAEEIADRLKQKLGNIGEDAEAAEG